MVLSIQDVYPESLVVQGCINKVSVWVNLLRNIDTWISHQAKMLIVISERFAQIYRESRQVEPEKIIVVPNWGDEGFFAKRKAGTSIREKYSIDNQAFLVVYGGNIGKAAGVETVIAAMGQLNTDQEILFLVAGSGTSLESCKQAAQRLPLARILFHSPWSVDETSLVLGASDVLVLPTQGNQSLVSVPSKMITYMLSSRPILALALPESEITHMILESGCGWVIDPDKPEQLARKIEEISRISEDQLIKIGQLGRTYALQNFVSEICLPKVIDVLLSTAVNTK